MGVTESCEGGTAAHFIYLLFYMKRCGLEMGNQTKQHFPMLAPAGSTPAISPGAPAPLCA